MALDLLIKKPQENPILVPLDLLINKPQEGPILVALDLLIKPQEEPIRVALNRLINKPQEKSILVAILVAQDHLHRCPGEIPDEFWPPNKVKRPSTKRNLQRPERVHLPLRTRCRPAVHIH